MRACMHVKPSKLMGMGVKLHSSQPKVNFRKSTEQGSEPMATGDIVPQPTITIG